MSLLKIYAHMKERMMLKRKEENIHHQIHVLMLVNWKVTRAEQIPEGIQPPDYVVPGVPYWFFRYMSPDFAVDVVDISAPKWMEKLEKRVRFYIWQTLRVLPHLNQYDLVVSHGMQSGIVLALWRRVFGRGRYRHVVFDIGAFNSGRQSGRALKLMQLASRSLDGVIYHTEIQREYYEACHPWLLDKSRFIPFGTDAEFFQKAKLGKTGSTEADGQDPAAAGKLQEPSYILSFGKIKRDWATLLKAYDESRQELPLKIVGNAELRSKNSRVEILPAVPLSKLLDLIRGAAFCVVPLEAMPYSYGQMTLLQQMAMGKAVIAADVPSLAAYHDGDGVVWYQPENAEDLAGKIDALTENPARCALLGERAAALIRTTYHEEKMAGEIQKFFLEVLNLQDGSFRIAANKSNSTGGVHDEAESE